MSNTSTQGETIMLAATALWCVLIVLYAAKWIWARAEALARCARAGGFVSAITLSAFGHRVVRT